MDDEIALAAQIISKQSPGIPLRNIESIIIQTSLEISKAQGAITGQTIFEVASQIKQNPNGVLTQAIIQLAKQDIHDNGKTDQTSNLIHKIVSEVREDRSDTLDKEATSHDDLFDAFRMSMQFWHWPTLGSS